MVRFRCLPFLLALASLAASTAAQRGGPLVPLGGPLRTATVRVATGERIPGGGAEESAALAPVFVNTDSSGFYGVGAGTNSATGNPIEWLDWGIVPGDTGSRLVGSFTFGYGTSVTDTSLGGPGASAVLRFYDGITGCCADSGTAPTATFSFVGLPGTTPGGGTGWLITVDLVGGFEFAHAGTGRPFGFGFTSLDDHDADQSRDTGPILCYAGDPHGPNGSTTQDPDANGQVSVFDEWDDTPASNLCLGTFFLQVDFFSWYLTLDAAVAAPTNRARSSPRNGTGVNPTSFSAQSPPVLGNLFHCTDLRVGGGLGSYVVGYASPSTLATPHGELLVDPTDPAGPLLTGLEGPYAFRPDGLASIPLPVPSDLRLCGFGFSVQAFEFGSGVRLKNALDLVLGF